MRFAIAGNRVRSGFLRARGARAAAATAFLAALICLSGCGLFRRNDDQAADSEPTSRPVEPTSPIDSPFAASDRYVVSRNPEDGADPALRPARSMMVLAVLSVQIPESQAAAAQKIWEQAREEMLDAETRLRLQDNGFRAGIGHVQLWEPIRAVLDAIPDRRVVQTIPLRVPAGFPLALELDNEPRNQTLFYVGRDGVLRGATHPESRNVLRIAYGPDVRRADRIRMAVVPETQQKQEGWRWVRTEEGLWQVPRQQTNAFEDVSFDVSLARDEFLLIAPSENARLHGLIGRAMLSGESEGRSTFTYVFLRPEVPDVGQHD
ncbi:MAG: hypothetical protein HZB38_04080 [Planctomycetes bacterium]|nr:hypothetical protein [Planctomycetota bacterium]